MSRRRPGGTNSAPNRGKSQAIEDAWWQVSRLSHLKRGEGGGGSLQARTPGTSVVTAARSRQPVALNRDREAFGCPRVCRPLDPIIVCRDLTTGSAPTSVPARDVAQAEEFKQIFRRMGSYAPGSTPSHPQVLLPWPRGDRSPMHNRTQDRAARPSLDYGGHPARHHVRTSKFGRRRGSRDHEAGRGGNSASAAYLPRPLNSKRQRNRLNAFAS